MNTLSLSNSEVLHSQEFKHFQQSIAQYSLEIKRLARLFTLFYEKPFKLQNVIQFTEILKTHPTILTFSEFAKQIGAKWVRGITSLIKMLLRNEHSEQIIRLRNLGKADSFKDLVASYKLLVQQMMKVTDLGYTGLEAIREMQEAEDKLILRENQFLMDLKKQKKRKKNRQAQQKRFERGKLNLYELKFIHPRRKKEYISRFGEPQQTAHRNIQEPPQPLKSSQLTFKNSALIYESIRSADGDSEPSLKYVDGMINIAEDSEGEEGEIIERGKDQQKETECQPQVVSEL